MIIEQKRGPKWKWSSWCPKLANWCSQKARILDSAHTSPSPKGHNSLNARRIWPTACFKAHISSKLLLIKPQLKMLTGAGTVAAERSKCLAPLISRLRWPASILRPGALLSIGLSVWAGNFKDWATFSNLNQTSSACRSEARTRSKIPKHMHNPLVE